MSNVVVPNPLEETLTKDELIERLALKIKAAQGVDQPKIQLQWDDFLSDFEADLTRFVNKQVQEQIDAQPIRTLNLSPGAFDGLAKGLANNRYRSVFRDLYQDGRYRMGNKQLTPADVHMAVQMMEKAHKDNPDLWKGPSEDLVTLSRALSPTTAGLGLELIDESRAGTLWADVNLASVVVSNMDPAIDPMPTDPYPIPHDFGNITFKKLGVNQPTVAQDPSTGESVLRTNEIGAEVVWPYQMDEDAVVAMMPNLRAVLVRNAGEAMDDFALNADKTATATGNINSDDAAPVADSLYLVTGDDGIRHQWLVDNTAMTFGAGGDALVIGDYTSTLAKMGRYASNPNVDVLTFTDISTYLNGFLKLAEVMTVDKFGSPATIKTGQLGSLFGVPLMISAVHRLAASDGKVNSSTGNTLGSFTTFNKSQWKVGFKRSMLIETATDIRARQVIMVISFRMAITNRGTLSTNTHTAGCANILV